jgi:hypothetical protein
MAQAPFTTLMVVVIACVVLVVICSGLYHIWMSAAMERLSLALYGITILFLSSSLFYLRGLLLSSPRQESHLGGSQE